MTMLSIAILLDNDAMLSKDGEDVLNEYGIYSIEAIEQILKQVPQNLRQGLNVYDGLKDANGNIVGGYAVLEEDLNELTEE